MRIMMDFLSSRIFVFFGRRKNHAVKRIYIQRNSVLINIRFGVVNFLSFMVVRVGNEQLTVNGVAQNNIDLLKQI
jgi:hypothetical protein